MALAARPGELVLSTGGETLTGTVAGTTLNCRVRPGVGLGARLTTGMYRFSAPTEHATMGTIACATFVSSGSAGGPRYSRPGAVDTRGETGAVMFDPDRIQIDKSAPWHGDTGGGQAKGETDLLRWTGVGSPGTLVFTARATGASNGVVVLTSFDPLIKALTVTGGCPLIVGT